MTLPTMRPITTRCAIPNRAELIDGATDDVEQLRQAIRHLTEELSLS